jgi:hypothetical protein
VSATAWRVPWITLETSGEIRLNLPPDLQPTLIEEKRLGLSRGLAGASAC